MFINTFGISMLLPERSIWKLYVIIPIKYDKLKSIYLKENATCQYVIDITQPKL